jgi:hypothetical protein
MNSSCACVWPNSLMPSRVRVIHARHSAECVQHYDANAIKRLDRNRLDEEVVDTSMEYLKQTRGY